MTHLIVVWSILFVLGIVYSCIYFRLEAKDCLNILILSITAVALIWSTTESNKNSNEARKSDLRPVILRDGFIDWSDFKNSIKTSNIQVNFFVSRNIATNISGYIVVDNNKYPLSFSITTHKEGNNYIGPLPEKDSVAGWTLSEKPLMARTFSDRYDKSNESEGFYLFYSDIEGNCYKTFENSNHTPYSIPVHCQK